MGLRPLLIVVVCGAKSCLPGFYVRHGKDREAHTLVTKLLPLWIADIALFPSTELSVDWV